MLELLIACLLIHHFNMEWWWYAIAGVIAAPRLFIALAALSES